MFFRNNDGLVQLQLVEEAPHGDDGGETHLAWTSQGDFFLTSRWKINVPLAVFSDFWSKTPKATDLEDKFQIKKNGTRPHQKFWSELNRTHLSFNYQLMKRNRESSMQTHGGKDYWQQPFENMFNRLSEHSKLCLSKFQHSDMFKTPLNGVTFHVFWLDTFVYVFQTPHTPTKHTRRWAPSIWADKTLKQSVLIRFSIALQASL